MKNPHTADRRAFLKTATSIAVAGGLPTLESLTQIAHAANGIDPLSVDGQYKAIVCVFLYGGQDHSNLLIPYRDGDGTSTTEYVRYRTGRAYGADPQNQSSSTGDLSYSNPHLSPTVIASTGTDPGTTGTWTTHTYGRQFAMHPSYGELRSLYNSGKLAVMANVGPLVAPMNRHQWYAEGAARPPVPLGLYSHDDQQKAWQSGTAHISNPPVGAGGRIAALLASMNGAALISTQVSISGVNTFMLTDTSAPSSALPYQLGTGSVGRLQTATTTPSATPSVCNTHTSFMNSNPSSPYCVNGGPIRVSNGFTWDQRLNSAFRARINTNPEAGASVYQEQWRMTMHQSITTEVAITNALLASPPTEEIVAPFVGVIRDANNTYNSLAAQLQMVAALIRASMQLGAAPGTGGMKRQIFFVSLGGFDTHGSDFWTANPALNARVSKAINAFWAALGNIQVVGVPTQTARDRVTLFTQSDFGRTLDSNGKGSDHGWGTHQMVLGGAVRGGKIYGMNHNVSATTAGSSVWLSVDSAAGAVPRVGIPPDRYSGALTAPGAKCNGLNHSLERGELLPTMACDAMTATIAQWFGVTPTQLSDPASPTASVFPTLYATHGSSWNVGFMSP